MLWLLATLRTSPHLAQNLAPLVRSPPHRLQILSVMFLSLSLMNFCVLSVASLDLSYALPADLWRRHARSPKGHSYFSAKP